MYTYMYKCICRCGFSSDSSACGAAARIKAGGRRKAYDSGMRLAAQANMSNGTAVTCTLRRYRINAAALRRCRSGATHDRLCTMRQAMHSLQWTCHRATKIGKGNRMLSRSML